MLNVIVAIQAARKRNAYAPALITDSRVISYGDLEALIARVSNYLVDRGTPPLTKVFINVADPDLRFVVMLAAMHAGMIPFALLQQSDKDELGPHIVLGSGPPHVADLAADIMIDQTVLAGPAGDSVLREFADRDDKDILYVGSTTGTTGTRKLVAMLQGALKKLPPGLGLFGFAPGQRIMLTYGDATTPGVGLLHSLLRNGGTHVRYPREADRCVRLINFTGVTRLMTTPSTASELLDVMERAGARCPSVTDIFVTGSLFQKRLIERLERSFEARITVAYGSTEAGLLAAGPVTASTFEVGYVGKLVRGITLIGAGTKDNPAPVTIIRSEAQAPPPYYVKGKLAPSPRGPVAVPDIGYMQGDSLYLLGRGDEVFNFSGNKTAFSIIEHDLLAMPGVADVGMVGGAAIGDFADLVVAVAGAADLDAGALKACVTRTAQVTGAESSIHIVRVGSVARNAMGKVDREAIVRAYRQAQGSA